MESNRLYLTSSLLSLVLLVGCHSSDSDLYSSAAGAGQLESAGSSAGSGSGSSSTEASGGSTSSDSTPAFVNTAPSFIGGPNHTASSVAGPQALANWARSINDGDSDADQQLQFAVTTTRPDLFDEQPTVSYPSGTLRYNAKNTVTGAADVTVRLQDDAGTENGGMDTSAPYTFQIIVGAAENNLPSFKILGDVEVGKGAQDFELTGWAYDMSDGDGESQGLVGFQIISNTNPHLFSVQPHVSYPSGTLRFSLKDDVSGSALMQLRLRDVPGSYSAAQAFKIDTARLKIVDIPFVDDDFRQCVIDTGLTYADEVEELVCNVPLELTGLDSYEDFDLNSSYDGFVAPYPDLYDVSGLMFFKNLRVLAIAALELNEIDTSQNAMLEEIFVFTEDSVTGAKLTLDVSNNPGLKHLTVLGIIHSLNISNNSSLTGLFVIGVLSDMDISNNTALTEVILPDNLLTSLDVSNNRALVVLRLGENKLTSLDVSNNPELEVLLLNNNDLTSIDLTNNLLLRDVRLDTGVVCVGSACP